MAVMSQRTGNLVRITAKIPYYSEYYFISYKILWPVKDIKLAFDLYAFKVMEFL